MSNAPVVALAIAGGIASGKTSLAKALSEHLACPWTSFGDCVRTVAAEQGLDTSRETLQAVGEALIGAGWDPFCRRTLGRCDWCPGGRVVIDGIRHVEAIRHLQAILYPVPLLLLFVQTDQSLRRKRLARRDDPAGHDLEQIESHPTEVDAAARLADMAERVLDGSQPITQTVAEVVLWLSAKSVS